MPEDKAERNSVRLWGRRHDRKRPQGCPSRWKCRDPRNGQVWVTQFGATGSKHIAVDTSIRTGTRAA
ncbi:hypothetical protein N9L68_08670 [bacterium]|nr:hypothetical protein [bacterium]